MYLSKASIKQNFWTFLVVQWIRICLPLQGTQVQSLIREDCTCHWAARPMRHNCWALTLEPASCDYWARMLQLLKPVQSRACEFQVLSLCSRAHAQQLLKPVHPRARAPQQEKPLQREDCTAMKSSCRWLQLEKSPHKAMKTQGSQE